MTQGHLKEMQTKLAYIQKKMIEGLTSVEEKTLQPGRINAEKGRSSKGCFEPHKRAAKYN